MKEVQNLFSNCNWNYCCEQLTLCNRIQVGGQLWNSELLERTKSQGCFRLPYWFLANCFLIFKDSSVICAKT